MKSYNLKMDLQLFADPSASLQNTTGTMTNEMKTFYEKRLIDQAEPRLVHDQFAEANPEMRRLMELPGMRMGDAYRLAHYNDALRQTAQTVEQGVVERIRQRSARPAENGTSPGGAAITRADVASMTRAQREALERRAMHGVKISF